MTDKEIRPAGEPGPIRESGRRMCGYDGGITDADCGAPAVVHGYISAELDPQHGPYGVAACEAHSTVIMLSASDWHPFGDWCDMPGSTWIEVDGMPGFGRCQEADHAVG